MALFAKYYITSPRGVYIDWSSYNGFSLLNKEGALVGGNGDDYVSIGAGNTFDSTDLMSSRGNDTLFLTGRLSDYTQSVDGNGTYIFTRTAGLPSGQTEVIKFSSTWDADTVYFADGHVVLQSYSVQGSGTPLQNQSTFEYRNILAGDLLAGGTPANIGASLSGVNLGTEPTKVYIFNPSGFDIPKLPMAGESMSVIGGMGNDSYFAAAGTSADGIDLMSSKGSDKLYLTGNFSDYTQTVDSNGVYTFTRTAGLPAGQVEVVKFSSGADTDAVYFANGHLVIKSDDIQLTGTSLQNQDSFAFRNILEGDLIAGGTPLGIPDAPTLNVSDIDGDGKIDVSGIAEPGSTVTVTWPDGTTSTVVTDPVSGAYSVESPTVQPNGDVKAKVTDTDGNVSAETINPYTSTIAVDEPTLNVTDSDNDGKINVSGVAKPNSTVSVTWPDGTVSTTVADGTGKYVIESPTVQENGEVKAKYTDTNGVVSSETINYYNDNQVPVVPTLNVSDSDNDGKIDVSGIAEPGSTVTVTWPDGISTTVATDPVSGAYIAESPTVQESGDVKAKVTDVNGNESAEVISPYVDTQVPDAPTLNVSDIDGDGKIDVSGVAEPKGVVTVTWPDGTTSTVVTDPVSGAYSVESPTVQPNGDVKAKATDVNGNVGAETINPYTNSTAIDEPTLNVTDSDNDGKIDASGVAKPNSTVSVTWPDGTVSTTVADGTGKYVIESPTVQISGEVKAKYTDTNGVVSSETVNYYNDYQGPVAPTLNVSDSDNDGRINVSGVAEPKSTVTITWPDGTTSTVVTDPVSGAYSVESPTVQPNGDVKAKATDTDGNVSAETINPYTNSTAIDEPTLNVTDSDNDGKIDASGVAKPNSTVSVTWPDGSVSTTVADATGKYLIESPTVQENGEVKAKYTDTNGVVSSETVNYYNDNQVPVAPTLNVSDSDNDGRINVSGVAEPKSTVTITWPDGTTSTAVADPVSGAYSVESSMVQANGNLKATVTDVNGNVSTDTTSTYIDTQAPIAPTLNVSDSDNDGRIDASGVAEPKSTVTVTWPDGTSSTVVTDPVTGAYSVESPSVQLSGDVKAKATDINGNTGTETIIAYSDTQAPLTPTLNVSDIDNDGKIDVSGVAEPESTVTITWPDGTTSTVSTDPVSGAYSIESPTVQKSGDVKAKVTDANGNISAEIINPYIDTQAPVMPTLNVSDIDGDRKINVSGVAEPESIVTITWPDGTTSTVLADAVTGAYLIESPTVQTSGDVKAKATDADGNVSAEKVVAYSDTQAPLMPTLVVSDSDNDGKINVSGVAEPESTVTITWPDGTTSTAVADSVSGAYSVESPTVQTSGDVKAKATDADGNISAEKVVAYSDTQAPIAPTLNVSDSDSDGKINASGVAEPESIVTITWPDGTTSTAVADPVTGAYSIESPTLQTSGDVKAKATDANGNVSSETINPYTDTIAPLMPTLVVSDSDNDGKINVSGVSEPESTVTITWPDGTTSTVVADAVTGAYSVESPTVQENGDVKAKATDADGNISAEKVVAYSDTQAPIAPTLNVSDSDSDGKINASGVAEPESTVTITWPDGTTSTVVADAVTGAYSVESPTVQPNGDVKAKATDTNGNIGAETTTVYTDTTAPVTPTLNVNDSDNDGKINASGTAEPKSTVTITWPDGTTSTVLADAVTGAYSIESPTVQMSGDVKAKATDINGRVGNEITNYYTDMTAPVMPTLVVNDSDNDGKINVSGIAEPESTVTITWPDGTTSTAVADPVSGAYSAESPTVQTSGDVKAKATDADGNISAEKVVAYSDTQAPIAPTLNVSDSDSDGKINASGVAEPESTVTVTWPDGTTSTAVADPVTGSYSVESPTVQISGNVKAKATDTNGNIGAETTTVYTDTTAPSTPTLNVNDSDNDGKINASGIAEPKSTVTVTWPDGTTSTAVADPVTGAYSVESPTVQSNGDVKAKATDTNGNVGAETVNPYTSSIPINAPTLNVSDSDNDGKINASGIAKPNSTVNITWPDGTTNSTMADPVTGAYSIESLVAQTNGDVKAKSVDSDGIISAETINPYRDTQAPIAPTLNVSDSDSDGKINASGVAEAGSTVTVTWPDGTTSTTVADSVTGAYSVESPSVQANGNVKAKATDINGNISSETMIPYSDSTAPIAPTLNVNDSDNDGKINASGLSEAGSSVTVTWPDGTTSTVLADPITGMYSVESPTVQLNGDVKAKATDINGRVSSETINAYVDTKAPDAPTLNVSDSDNDGKINVSGIAEPKSTVTITWPDGTTSTVVADAVTGMYSVESSTLQPTGNVKAKATDVNNNNSSETINYYSDLTVPVIPSLNVSDSDSDGKINASGIAEPKSTVTVTWPDGTTSTVMTDPVSGAYSVESPTVQSNGDVKAKATDEDGNVSSEATNRYTDMTNPVAPALNVSDSDNDGKIDVSGVAEAGSTVTITWPDGTTSTVMTDPVTGAYSAESPTSQPSGDVKAKATDINGNISPEKVVAYVDIQTPVAPTLNISDSDSDGKIDASGVSEAGSSVTITWPDGTTSTVVADAVTGAYSVESPTVQSSGDVKAKATDINGKVSSEVINPYIDKTVPLSPTLNVSDSDNDGKINASGVSEPGSTVTITWPDGTTSTVMADAVTGVYSVESPTVQADGDVKAKATDINGNTGTETTTAYSDITASIAPTLTINDNDNNGKINVSGIAEPKSTVTITWPDGTTSTVATDPITGAYSVESPTAQPNGDVKAKATDINGNTGAETIVPYNDTQAPVAPTLNVIDSDNDGKIDVSGVAEAGSTLTITWPDGTTSTVVADAVTGAYSFESPTVQSSGDVKVKSTDVNNNDSTEVINPYRVIPVPLAPTLTIDDSDNDGRINANGVAIVGSTVTITWPDGTTSTVVADAVTGAYSVESPNVQLNGDVKAQSTDSNGIVSSETINPYMDTQAPAIPTLNVSDSDNDGKINASGVAEAGSTVTITWPDGTTSTVIADAVTGAYSVESPTVQTSGDVKAKATDINLNTGAETTTAYSDTQAPVEPTLVVNDSDSNGKINASGVAEPESTVTITWPDGTTSTALADATTGAYSVESPTVQSSGDVKAKATDANGNTGVEKVVAYTDTTAPIAPTLVINDSDNDGRINANGVAEAGSTVTITWPDGTTSTVATDPVTGAYSVESPNAQANGDVKAKATDADGNTGVETTTAYSDTQAPVVPTLNVTDSDNDGKVNVNGVAEVGSTVTITWPDGTTSTVVADPTTGAYSIESTNAQPSGSVKAKSTDVNGNISPEITTAYSDTTAPVAPTLLVSDSDNDGKINTSGIAEAGSTVTITWPDETISTVVADAVTGAYSVESPTVQTNGNVKAKSTDVNGNVSAETIIAYTDIQAPITPTLVVSDSDNDGKINVSGMAEPGSTVTITWPDGTTSAVPTNTVTGAYSFESPTVQTNGDVKAKATDINGNVSSEIVVVYTDTQAPDAPTLNVNDSDSDGKINASGVAEAGSTVTITWPDGTTSTVVADPTTGAYSIESPTVQTNGDVKAKATDQNGNVSTEIINPYADTTVPVTPTLLVSDSDSNGKINVSGIAEPKATVTVTWPDRTTSTVVADALTGAYSVESPTVQLNGDVKAKSVDINGNISSEITTAYVDTTAPLAPTLNLVDSDSDGRINVSGVAEPGSTVTVTWPDGSSSSVPANSSTGAYSVESPMVQVNGNVVAKVTDINGNVGPTTTTAYVDTTPPLAATLIVSDSDNDGRINVSGVAEPKSTVTIKWTDGTTSTVVADAVTGAYSLESTMVQLSGNVIASVTDVNGNAGLTTTTTAYNDTQAPFAATLSVIDSDSDEKINASGVAEASSTVTITWPDGTTSTVVADAVTGAYSVESSTVQESGNVVAKVTDVNGNMSVTTTTYYTDVTPPVILNLAIVSATGIQNNFLNAGDTLTLDVGMIQRVNVTGTPLLSLNIGGTIVQASYLSGSGTNTLKFTYTILAGQNDANGISINANSLSLNGGTIKDFAGNNLISTHTSIVDNISYKVDTTPPAAPSLSLVTDSGSSSTDGITNVATINVASIESGAIWEYKIDGGAWTTGSASSFNAIVGSHTYYVRQTDLAGNLGASSVGVAYNYDITPPAAPSLSLATDSGSSASDGITNISTINVASIESGASWQYKIDSGAWNTGTGSSFTAIAGTHTYYVRQTDVAGNLGNASTGVSYTFDITPPVAPSLSLAVDSGSNTSDGITNVSTINVSGLESGASWQYSIDGGAWNNGSGSSFNASAGNHTYYIRQTDVAGNTSASSAGSVYNLDTIAPTAPSLSLAVDSGSSSNDGITIVSTINVGGLESGASWQYSIDGGAWTNGSVSSFNASAGSHTYQVRQTDKAGNTSAPSVGVIYNLDISAPIAPSLSLATDSGSSSSDGITNVSTINVGSIESGASWEYSIDGGAWNTGSGSSFNASSGNHTYYVRQTDTAGNGSGWGISTYTLDTSTPAPNFSITDDIGSVTGTVSNGGTTDDNNLYISGTAEANSSVDIYSGTSLLATVGADSSGNWSYNTGVISDGSYSFSATATDVAGNSATTSTYSVTVDTIPPGVVLLSGTPYWLILSNGAGVYQLDINRNGVIDDGDSISRAQYDQITQSMDHSKFEAPRYDQVLSFATTWDIGPTPANWSSAAFDNAAYYGANGHSLAYETQGALSTIDWDSNPLISQQVRHYGAISVL